jgi:hypothetical protein
LLELLGKEKVINRIKRVISRWVNEFIELASYWVWYIPQFEEHWKTFFVIASDPERGNLAICGIAMTYKKKYF